MQNRIWEIFREIDLQKKENNRYFHGKSSNWLRECGNYGTVAKIRQINLYTDKGLEFHYKLNWWKKFAWQIISRFSTLAVVILLPHFFRKISVTSFYTVRRSYLNNFSIKSYTKVVQIWPPHRVWLQILWKHFIHGAAFISEQLYYKILYQSCSDIIWTPHRVV